MPFALLLAVLVAGQPARVPSNTAVTERGAGRFFISPMGEPFYGRTAGEDGLVVWFEKADANHDGAITSDEMAADADRFFAVLDRQRDGEIDPDDVAYYEREVAPQLRVQTIFSVTDFSNSNAKRVDDESSSGRYGLLTIPQPVTSADTNFNRGVSPTEFRSAAQRRFQILDTAGAGRLSLVQLEGMRRAAIAVSKRRPTEHTPLPDVNAGEDQGNPGM